MSIIVFLRSISDAGLLLCAGASIAVHYGAAPLHLLFLTLISAIANAISFVIWYGAQKAEEKKTPAEILRFIPYILPAAAGILLKATLPEIILCGIIFAYMLYLAITKKYFPDAEQQKTIFKISCGLFAAMLVILLFIGARQISFTVCIISGLTTLICSVLVMRSLRHESAEYSKTGFQLVNIGILAVFAGAAYGLSRPAVINGFLFVLKRVYDVIANALLFVIMWIIRLIGMFFSWLRELFGEGDIQPPPEPVQQIEITDNQDLFGEYTEVTGPPGWLRTILIILAVIAALLIIFLIFRAISGRRGKTPEKSRERGYYDKAPAAVRHRQSSSSDIKGVRKQYRKYLQFLKNNGIIISSDMTTEEIERAAKEADPLAAKELRRLYLEARYGQESDSKSEERAKELLRRIKRERKANA